MKDNQLVIVFKDGEPCKHAGCKSHVSHPCEGCGRKEAKGIVEIPKYLIESWKSLNEFN